MADLGEMQLKSIRDAPYLKHRAPKARLQQEEQPTEEQPVDETDELAPEIAFLEKIVTGFLGGASGATSTDCTANLEGLVYYAFEMVKNREIYLPWKAAALTIAFQKFQEKSALFSA